MEEILNSQELIEAYAELRFLKEGWPKELTVEQKEELFQELDELWKQ
jgi:hypothetical protein